MRKIWVTSRRIFSFARIVLGAVLTPLSPVAIGLVVAGLSRAGCLSAAKISSEDRGAADDLPPGAARCWSRHAFACNDLTMSAAGHQTLRVLDGSYVLDRPADVTDVDLRADVLAVVFGPDGSTVMRRDDAGEDAWSALWNGDEAHDVQATGMLSAIVAPLGAAGVPVWVVSGFDGDLVLVPADRLDEACGVLQAAGHQVRR
jgi:hypothetical protein